MRYYPRGNILGVGISAINLEQAYEAIERWIQTAQKKYITVTPVHGIMDCQSDPEFRRIVNRSGLTTPDGMGVVWILKLMGYSNISRVYGPDLMELTCAKSVKKEFRHFLYGGDQGVAQELAGCLRAMFPGIKIVGFFSPPFRALTEEEAQDVADRINASQADIVWVGISTPKQEKWMARFHKKTTASVFVGVGAAFDFLSNRKPQAPRWVQRSGLEWLFRLITEPDRLWRRYIRYPYFIILLLAQWLGIKKYELN